MQRCFQSKYSKYAKFRPRVFTLVLFINPRRACAERVTVVTVQYVTSFADRNGLKLSTEKCGIVITGRDGLDPPSSVAGLPVVESVKCLGVWWCSNSSSRKSIEERICKARRAFFANGDLGAFHGLLNPLSSRSLVESCVFPVLMYGAEAWSITASLLLKLESFQSEIGKKILRLPRFTANLVLCWL